jgi:nucleoside-diphosphate-sugar epimerase
LCYVDDQVRGLLLLLDSQETGPINIGSQEEISILELAGVVIELTGSRSRLSYKPLPADDPRQRRPDTTLAEQRLEWLPQVGLREGLGRTIDYFRQSAPL